VRNATLTGIRWQKPLDSLRAKDWEALRSQLRRLYPSDIADFIVDLPAEEAGIVFRLLPRKQAARVFAQLKPGRQEALLHSLSSDELRQLLDAIPPDDRTRLFEELPPIVTRKLMESLSPAELTNARRLLGYPENTAGRFMTPKYVSVSPTMTAAEALAHIRTTGADKETLNVIYVVDEKGRLVEDLRIGSLVLADPATKVTEIEDPVLVSILPTDSVDDVLRTFERYRRVALPVADRDHTMLGIITVDDVLNLAEQKTTRDIQRAGGTEALDASYLDTGFWSLLRKRGGWLSALFLGEMLTATAMSHFEGEIQRAVVLALFVPLIISSGGNSGSQATSLMIRSLALRELRLRDWIRVFRRELMTGFLLGAFLGFIGFLRIVLWERLRLTDYGAHYLLVAVTVWASLIGVVMFGSVAGSMLPFVLRRLGFDPATSSAPFVATLVDVTGLVIYFSIALLILRGTLL